GEMRTNNPYREWLTETKKRTIARGSESPYYDKEKRGVNIRNFKRDAFVRFYKEWYRPDLEAAIVVGDIDVDSLETEIKRLFSDLEMPDNPKDPSQSILDYNIDLDGKNRFHVQLNTVNTTPRLLIFAKRPNPEYSR